MVEPTYNDWKVEQLTASRVRSRARTCDWPSARSGCYFGACAVTLMLEACFIVPMS